MSIDPMAELRAKARRSLQRVALPEADDKTILCAARQLRDEGLAVPVLVSPLPEITSAAHTLGLDLTGLEIIDAGSEDIRLRLVEAHGHLFPGFSAKVLERRLRSPLNLATLLVAAGHADALVAGIRHTTEDVILAALTFLGMEPGVKTPSSMLVMYVPSFAGPQGPLMVFADCAVVIAPDAEELADIAVAAARTTRLLLGWEPRVAMLSFSTMGSAEHDSVTKVREAVLIARQRDPGLLIDGEFQLDAAIVPSVAAKKVSGDSPVAGRANVLIFPDLNAGNIACKCVQRFAGGDLYGPFLQGFAGTVSDLSRGASVADVVGAAVMAAVQAQGRKAPGRRG
jgi:phosphate acetyltransferase